MPRAISEEADGSLSRRTKQGREEKQSGGVLSSWAACHCTGILCRQNDKFLANESGRMLEGQRLDQPSSLGVILKRKRQNIFSEKEEVKQLG